MIAFALCAAQLLTATPLTWTAEARLDLPGNLSASQQEGAPSGTSSFNFAPKLTLTLYAQRLHDDPAVPLGLLLFLQHPDLLDVELINTVAPGNDAGSSLGGTVGGTFYPWQSVGFMASTTLTAGATAGTLNSAFTAGLVDYVNERSRLQLEWMGTQNKTGHWFSTASNGAVSNLIADDASTNRGRLSITWAPPSNNWLIGGTAELGWGRSSEVTASSLQALTSSDSRGPFYSVFLTVNAYLGRWLFVGSLLGIHGSGRTNDTVSGSIISTGTLTPWVNPYIQYFLTESILVRFAYELDYTRSWNVSGAATNAFSHTVTFTLAARW